MTKEASKFHITSTELHTILVWYETLQQEGGNEEEDDTLYERLEQHWQTL